VKLGKRRAWIAALGVLMLLALVMRACWPVAEQVSPDPGPAVAMSASQPASRPLVSSAAPVAHVNSAAQRPETRWCELGAKAGSDLSGLFEPDERELAKLLRDEIDRMEHHLLQSLRADPSTRAQAVAEWLPSAYSPNSSARLQELARRSRDPFVIQLALLRTCTGDDACHDVERGLWAEVEPDSLAAALLQAESDKSKPAAQRWSRLLQKNADNSFAPELLRVLEQHLPAVAEAGLRQAAQFAILEDYGSTARGAVRPRAMGLLAACRSTELGSERTQICEGVAEKLWTSSSATELGDVMALALVGDLPERSGHWQQRAQQHDALRLWRQGQGQAETHQAFATYYRCGSSEADSPWRRRVFAESEWAFTRSQMQQAGADEQALAQRWRAQADRSLLDAPHAASAAPRH
jgi:hypothetical protein